MAYSSAKPRGAADRAFPDGPLPRPSRARGGVAAEDAHRSERQTGSRRVRRPRPGNVGVEGRVSDRPTDWRMPPWHPPQRTPGRKPGSGALIEPTIGLRDANRATRRVPRALAGPSSEFPLRRIVIFVQPWSILTILRSLKAKMHDYLRYRETHARTIDKNVRSPLPRPRKTVCFDRQRPKPTVFRIAHPPRQPNPMLNKQHSRHRSRRWRASSPGLRTLITGIGFYHHRDWSGVTIPEFCRILDAFLRH